MAGEPPVYESTARVPAAPDFALQPINAPAPDTSAVGDALTKLGNAGAEFSAKIAKAQIDGQDATLKTQYLKGINGLSQDYSQYDDWEAAQKGFNTERDKLEKDLLGQVPDPNRRAALGLYFTVHGATAQKEVNTKVLTKQADAQSAGLNDRSADYVRKIASTGSPVERAALTQSWNDDIDAAANAGWISRVDASRRKAVGAATLDDASVMSLIKINPAAALEGLQDPEKFKGIGPLQRENLINQAQASLDELKTAELANVATRDPARAAVTVGRVGGAVDANAIFRRGILGIETNGDPNSESPKGASGLSQLMPDTARAQLRRFGRDDIAKLDDPALKAWLKANPDDNVRLGLSEWNDLLGRYDGRVAVAAAGYNAGPGKADEWMRKAVAKYGEYFTTAEFRDVVDFKETRDYIDRLHAKLGAPMDGGGLSPRGQLHASTVVHAALQQQQTEYNQSVISAARISQQTDDPATIYKAGYNVDPARYAGWKQTQLLAAQAGDMEAAKNLREAEFQREMLPYRQQALRTPPAQLETLVGAEEARLSGLGDVPSVAKTRLDVARETLKSVKQARNDNIIGLAEQAQLVPEGQRVSIDPAADPGGQDFRKALALRGAQANSAASFYQGQAIALKPEELKAMKERYANAGPDEKFRLLQAFGTSLSGQAYTETLAKITEGHGGAEAAGMVGRMAIDRPELAREILRGAELLKSKEVSEKASAVKPALSSKLGGLIYPDPAQQKMVESAALALYVSRSGTDGTLYDATDSSGIEKAIEDITGPIVKRNGVKTPIAPGIEPGRFIGVLDKLTQSDVNLMGGAYDRSGQPVSPSDLGNYAVLKPLAPGSPLYVVGMRDARSRDGFAPLFSGGVADGGGSPLVFNMAVLTKAHPDLAPAWTPGKGNEAAARFRAGQAARIQADRQSVMGGGQPNADYNDQSHSKWRDTYGR